MTLHQRYSLAGKAAIVTGAGGGIGAAICVAFAQAGASVAVVDVDEKKAAETVKKVESAGARGLALACDVSSEAQTKAAVEKAASTFGRIDVLVNGAAGADPSGSVLDFDLATWNRVLAIHVGGAFLMSKWAIPHMAKAGGGSIIHIASQLGSVGTAGRAPYCTAKGALINLARAMAADHAAQKVRVNTISPGGVETDRMMRFGTMEKAREVLGALHLQKRLGLPEEIAAGALFLASDASSFMTGSDLKIDGGYTAV